MALKIYAKSLLLPRRKARLANPPVPGQSRGRDNDDSDSDMKYPIGSIIKKGNERRKILGETGEVRFVSIDDCFEKISHYIFTCKELENAGWVEEAKPWEPTFPFWYVNGCGEICQMLSSCEEECLKRFSAFKNCFPTKEAAEARLKEIKEKLGIN